MNAHGLIGLARQFCAGEVPVLRDDGFLTVAGLQYNGDVGFVFDASIANAAARALVQQTENNIQGLTGLAELYLAVGALATGPKVFTPSAADCRALEEIELRLHPRDFSTPFPFLLVELPAGYAGEIAAPARHRRNPELQATATPTLVVVHHQPGMPVVFCLALAAITPAATLEDSLAARLYPLGRVRPVAGAIPAHEQTLEEQLDPRFAQYRAEDGDDLPEGVGYSYLRRMLRVACNAALLLSGNAVVDRTRLNESYRRRTEYRLRRATARGDERHRALSAMDLAAIPTYYQLAQRVTVRDVVGSADAVEATPTGRHVRPHWRRAHWRQQPHGPGGTGRRPVLIPHTMVNRHRFGGAAADTTAVYHR